MARPITVSIGPLATADPDGAVVSQKAAAAEYLALRGALTNGQTANNVCQSQTPSSTFTLNGTLCSSVPTGSAVAYLGTNSRVYFTSASDISNRTITILGVAQGPGGLYAQTETLTGPNASTVASQKVYYSISSITISGLAAGAITVGRAGYATMDLARRVDIVSAGDDSGITFTLYGTDINGSSITEAVAGASAGTATSNLSFKTLTDVLTSGAVATTVEVGSSAIADSQWVRFDNYASNAQVAIQVEGSGTVNWTVQQTLDDPNVTTNMVPPNTYLWSPSAVKWVNHPDASMVGSTVTTGVQSGYAYTPTFARVTLNSGSGSVLATFSQSFLQ